jgi:hypothetical protein
MLPPNLKNIYKYKNIKKILINGYVIGKGWNSFLDIKLGEITIMNFSHAWPVF